MQIKKKALFLVTAVFSCIDLRADEISIVGRFANSFSLIESGDPERIGRGLKSLMLHLNALNPEKISLKNFKYIYENIPRKIKTDSGDLKYAGEVFRIWKSMHEKGIYPKESLKTNVIFKKYGKLQSINFKEDISDNYLGTFKILKSDIESKLKKILNDLKQDGFENKNAFKKIKILLRNSLIDVNLEADMVQVFLYRIEKFIKNNQKNIYLVERDLVAFLNELSKRSQAEFIVNWVNKLIERVKLAVKG